MPTENLRPHLARRDDARSQRTRNPAVHQGHSAGHPRRDVHQKRRGEHHGPGHWLEDCRLSHQTRQSQSDTPYAEEEHPPAADSHRGHAERLSAELPADCHADRQLQERAGLGGRLPAACALGTRTQQHRQFDDRDAQHAEGGGQQRLCQVHQEELSKLG